MRILLVSYIFQPEPSFVRGLAFARELVNRGHDVHVLTGFPNYPSGRIYEGYRLRWTQLERVAGVPVTRVALYPSHDRSGMRRSLSYISLALSEAAHALAFKDRFDISHVYLGPVTQLWPAQLLRRLHGTRVIADVQDLWPESVLNSGMMKSRLIGRALEWECGRAYRSADKLIAISNGYRRELLDRGVSAEKVAVLHNWYDETAGQSPSVPRNILRDDHFNVLYTGNFGKFQGLDNVLDAAKQLGTQPSPRPIHFALVGSGVEAERLAHRVRAEHIRNVTIAGPVSIADSNSLLEAADLLLLHLEPSKLTRVGIPQKLQAYLAAGRPILVAAEGDVVELFMESGAGRSCPAGDPSDLAELVLEFARLDRRSLDTLGANGRLFYERNLSFKAGVDRFEAICDGVLADGARSPADRANGGQKR